MNAPSIASLPTLSQVVQACHSSSIGKRLPGALYVHESALSELSAELRDYEARARHFLNQGHHPSQTNSSNSNLITLIKFSFTKLQISYLHYPDFFSDPHPALHTSIQVQLPNGELGYRSYAQTPNPPVLHRKETFLSPTHPRYADFARLTQQQEALRLLENSRSIGTRKGWQRRLTQYNIEIIPIPQPHHPTPRRDEPLFVQPEAKQSTIIHVLSCPYNKTSISSANPKGTECAPLPATSTNRPQAEHTHQSTTPNIERHKAAIVRTTLSKPVRLALEAGLLLANTTFFDYGCGHGGDIKRLANKGFNSQGWDPFYQPNRPHKTADVVNLGYIINVIENQRERREALINAWNLAQNVLIVAAQVLIDDRNRGWVAYEDGMISSRNTFQKYYEQEELKAYIDQVIGSLGKPVDAIPVAIGIYFVFRDDAQAQAFRVSRFRSRATTPRIRTSVRRFEEYKERLTPLMDFFTERGRLPVGDEVAEFTDLTEQFGSLKRAFRLVFQATETSEWDAITDKRRNDLLVYLALNRFDERRPKFKDLSPILRGDVKGLFGSYQQACAAADLMLMSLGNLKLLAQRAKASRIGQKRPHSLWIHITALSELDPLLRLYEGCASRTLGRPEEANVIKLSLEIPRVSYLVYPDFDNDPHPILQTQMRIDLQDLKVRYRDFDRSDNPPILHQKDHLLLEDYPLYSKFAKLTRQETDWGLLDDLSQVGSRDRWQQKLAEHCSELRGHRLVRRKDADPYKLKLLQSQARAQKKLRAQEKLRKSADLSD